MPEQSASISASAPLLRISPPQTPPPVTPTTNLRHAAPTCAPTQQPHAQPHQPQQLQQQRQQQRQLNDRDRVIPPSRQKKPRAWQAMFKRRPTNLAATSEPIARPGGDITSQAEFRRSFLKVHKDRVLRDNSGNCFRLLPIMMNGDCGFGAIAKGVNVARERAKESATGKGTERRRWKVWMRQRQRHSERFGRTLQAKDIRKAMLDEIKKARKTYLAGEEFTAVFSQEDFDKLEREVSVPGISGHWLGTVLGVLEHVIVAQALNVSIFLYQFDLGKQCIRQFESAIVDKPHAEVHLFFTGPAACGHFDTLVKISDPRGHLFVA